MSSSFSDGRFFREDQPAKKEGRILARLRLNIKRFGMAILWIGFITVLSVRAASNATHLTRALVAQGPNTVGEAGKVFFASKFQAGTPAFSTGDTPPYYPSIHGVLLHAPVGLLGRAFGASKTDLYWIGRSLSVVLTFLAWCLLFSLGRRAGVGATLLGVGFLFWLGSYSVTQHTPSYRPDNWLLFLSVLACWLVAIKPKSRFSSILLAALPVIAFHLKAPGIALAPAILGALLLQGFRTKAVILAVTQGTLLVISILVVDLASGGTFSAGLRSAGDMGLSLFHLTQSLWDPVLLGTLLLPAGLLFLPAFRDTLRHSPIQKTLMAFWLVTGILYGSAAARPGSNTYYFLEPFTFGILICLTWLPARPHVAIGEKRSYAPYLLAALLLGLPGTAGYLRYGPYVNIALLQTRLLGGDRLNMADRINAWDAYCFTDDPGLNVLLRRPAIIYPLLQVQSIDAGTLEPESLTQPLRTHEYDCVVLSGLQWSYRGLTVLPDSFYELVEEEYPSVERQGRYMIYRRP